MCVYVGCVHLSFNGFINLISSDFTLSIMLLVFLKPVIRIWRMRGFGEEEAAVSLLALGLK
jgi:hypothetical protein